MVITRYTPHDNRRACEAACNLIVEITRLLVDLTKFSDDYQYSQKLSLNPLHDTLFLTGLAIQAYENTPLAQNMNLFISPDIQKCHLILQGMLDTIDSYRQSLYRTPIYKLWPEVLWSGSEVQKLAWKLSIPKSSLGQFLVARIRKPAMFFIVLDKFLPLENIKRWMGRPWKRITNRPRISQRISWLSSSRPGLPGRHSNYKSTDSRPFGKKHTGAGYVLFELENKYILITTNVPRYSCRWDRSSITLSRLIVEVNLDMSS